MLSIFDTDLMIKTTLGIFLFWAYIKLRFNYIIDFKMQRPKLMPTSCDNNRYTLILIIFLSSHWIVYCAKKIFAMHLLCLRYILTTKRSKTITDHLFFLSSFHLCKRDQSIFDEIRLPNYPLLSL